MDELADEIPECNETPTKYKTKVIQYKTIPPKVMSNHVNTKLPPKEDKTPIAPKEIDEVLTAVN